MKDTLDVIRLLIALSVWIQMLKCWILSVFVKKGFMGMGIY